MKYLNVIRASAMVTALSVAAPGFAAPGPTSLGGPASSSPHNAVQPQPQPQPQPAQVAVAMVLAQATPTVEDAKAADAVPLTEAQDKTKEVAQPAKESDKDNSATAPGAPSASALVASPECIAELARAAAPGVKGAPVTKASKDCRDAAQTTKSDASRTGTDTGKTEAAIAMPSAPKTEATAPSSEPKTTTASETGTDSNKTEAAAPSETGTDSNKTDAATATPSASDTETAATSSEPKPATTTSKTSTDSSKTKTVDTKPSPSKKAAAAPSSEPKQATSTSKTSADSSKTDTTTAKTSASQTETAAPGSEPKQATSTSKSSTATVSDQEVQKSIQSGEDVVVADQISAEDRATIEQSQASSLSAAAAVATQEPVSVTEQVVTAKDTRSSTEESGSAPTASAADKDDNSIWKLIGAGGLGAAVGALLPNLGGKLVQDQGDRVIVERDGELHVHKDENLLLRRPGVTVQTEQFAGGIVRDTVRREDGTRVVTVRDAGGRILERSRILPDGREFILIDDVHQRTDQPSYVDWERSLPPRRQVMPGDRYIVESSGADRGMMREVLMAPPTHEPGRTFTLRDVRDNERVRAFMPRIDLDEVHFAIGSAAIDPSQVSALNAVGNSMAKIIEDNPREVFLIEGHTDAVGSNLMNLALSDRRAEGVALALSEYFPIPPENLVVQGYGERHLKQDTQGASQANRRVTIRRITPLIAQQPTASAGQPDRVVF